MMKATSFSLRPLAERMAVNCCSHRQPMYTPRPCPRVNIPADDRNIHPSRQSLCRSTFRTRRRGGRPLPPAAASAPEDAQPSRLFSNLGPDLRHQPGSVLGAATLVAGTAVGAGILALPAVTQPAGFTASALALTAAGIFSALTGLLVAEASLNTMCELGISTGVSLGSMAERTLGPVGKTIVSLTYVILHYSLLVAYIAKAGETLHQVSGLPLPAADAGFTLAVGGLCYLASPAILDRVNGVLVGAVIASFLGLLSIVAPAVDLASLGEAHWTEIGPALPVIALAFVFQNVCPYVCSSLEGDVTKIRTAIFAGLAVPWLMFLAWDAAVLGSTSGIEPLATATSTAVVADPLAAVRTAGPLASVLVDAFSLLAVATSFIGFVLGLSEFVAEALQLPVGRGKGLPYALTLLPPLGLALTFPGLFFAALDFAGTYGVLVLFGIVPAAMVWRERYAEGVTLTAQRAAPEGRGVLVLAGGAAGIVILDQLLTTIGVW